MTQYLLVESNFFWSLARCHNATQGTRTDSSTRKNKLDKKKRGWARCSENLTYTYNLFAACEVVIQNSIKLIYSQVGVCTYFVGIQPQCDRGRENAPDLLAGFGAWELGKINGQDSVSVGSRIHRVFGSFLLFFFHKIINLALFSM